MLGGLLAPFARSVLPHLLALVGCVRDRVASAPFAAIEADRLPATITATAVVRVCVRGAVGHKGRKRVLAHVALLREAVLEWALSAALPSTIRCPEHLRCRDFAAIEIRGAEGGGEEASTLRAAWWEHPEVNRGCPAAKVPEATVKFWPVLTR